MSSVMIQGGHALSGEVHIQGSKNAALPILAASLLHNGVVGLKNCPKILDVFNMLEVLISMGCTVCWEDDMLYVDSTNVHRFEVLKEDAVKTRGSFLFLGAMIGRNKIARIAYPGGCSIGKRNVDIHVKSMEEMGVCFDEGEDLIYADASNIHGAILNLSFPSVGATENLILASVLTEGVTEIINAAMEPEVTALCGFLNALGAKIDGLKTNHLIITGVEKLNDGVYTIPADRIVAGTYMVAAAACRGNVTLNGVNTEELSEVIRILKFMGCEITTDGDKIHLVRTGLLLAPERIVTSPYPGFPTDLQSQFIVLLSLAFNDSIMEEKIFENRFLIVQQLDRMGGKVFAESSHVARIKGRRKFVGEKVEASDLRGGAALIIAGLCASGTTIVTNLDYVKRGYVDIVKDLRLLGAEINWN